MTSNLLDCAARSGATSEGTLQSTSTSRRQDAIDGCKEVCAIETETAQLPADTDTMIARLSARLDAVERMLAVIRPHEMGDDLQREFSTLAQQWERDTQFSSSATEIAMHPAYQRIIGMGTAAIPLILAELEREPGHWFWALKAISGDDPVPEDARGKLPEMAQLWLDWGRRHGYAG